MKDGQKVLISDLDGTLISMSLSPRTQLLIQRLNLWPFIVLIFFPLYLMRVRKKSAKALILKHKKEGGRVVLFSATINSFLARKMIKAWLTIWRVPYDRLVLRPRNQKVKEFKYRILREEGCDILLENEPLIIYYLINHTVADGIKRLLDIIYKKKEGYFTIRFGENIRLSPDAFGQ